MSKEPWSPPPRYLFRRYNLISEIEKLTDARSFIDVGCGAGDLACTLSSRFDMDGVGVDFSKKAIKVADNLKRFYGLKKQPKFQHVDQEAMSKLMESDVVLCMEVLEHVKDDEELLKTLVGLSKKYVIISVPAKNRLFTHSDVLAGHYRRYEKKDLIKMLESNGLKVMSFISYGYPYTNLIRLARESVSKRQRRNKGLASIQSRSKKSGVDLLDINKYFSKHLNKVIYPLYASSKLFNSLNLSEGYLVVCEKK